MADLPSGTVTFLFTDIQGSTKLWERCPDAMRVALQRHNELLTALSMATAGTFSRPLATRSARHSIRLRKR